MKCSSLKPFLFSFYVIEDSTTKYNLDLTSEPDWLKYDLIVSGNERGADKTVCEAQNVPVQVYSFFLNLVEIVNNYRVSQI